jgi:2-oxoglutarate/2-oxoacid ferredoxin oxidoreductase subunit beta
MITKSEHPGALFLDFDKMPFVWCSGCGIGIVVNTFIQSLQKIPFPLERIQLVSSGLGCLGKIGDYLKLNMIHTQARDPFLTALPGPEKQPNIKTVIFIQDSDIMVHGLEGMIKACQSGDNVMIIYINGFILHILNLKKKCRDLTQSKFLYNLPALAHHSGAAVIARWTPLHCRRLISSFRSGLSERGVSFLEIVSPCLMYYAGTERQLETLDQMDQFLNNACINHQADWEELELRDLKKFYIGHFQKKNDS